jgi:hypothetical protein
VAVAKGAGPLPRTLLTELRQPLLSVSLRLRTALLIGLVFVMTAKPDPGSVLAIVGAGVVGLLWDVSAFRALVPGTEDGRAPPEL